VPSYSPVFSSQFIVYTSETPNLSYLVPTGFTAVVRDMEVTQNIGSFFTTVGFQNSPEAPECYCVTVEAVGAANSASWHGRIVVPAGGLVLVNFSEVGDFPFCYVGGYLLRNTLT